MKKISLVLALLLTSSLFAQTITYIEYLPVYKYEKTFRLITKRVPYQECWEEEVPISQSSSDGSIGALIGGVAGGIIGNQIGKGSGKTAATIGGAIVGTIVGKNLSQREASPGYKIVKRCRKRYKESHERIVEYKNYASFNGQEIVKYSNTPLKEIKVRVTIEY